ncbi:hypothetical protein PCANC_25720 [Puccinia coronata f. sp. avenae]|uniref:DUF4939 domain-containing protein n=1 Tax=Puccinia coronata f. sp. avenae TaxID=200324 RepID=A0A2N5U7J7_9BASI|nr:hypothetical protein PCANC_25720 [Puccinia coronata f. sp. avenae]
MARSQNRRQDEKDPPNKSHSKPTQTQDKLEMNLEDLQTQMSEMMTMMKEERRLHQEAEANPKIGVPDKYNGTRGSKVEIYVSQVGLYVIANPHLFPDDRSRMIFLISYLTGPESVWAQPFTQRLFDNGETKSVAQYTHTFHTHAQHTGWETPTLISQYTQGLKKEVRLALILARITATELNQVLGMALKINNKLHGADKTATNAGQLC